MFGFRLQVVRIMAPGIKRVLDSINMDIGNQVFNIYQGLML